MIQKTLKMCVETSRTRPVCEWQQLTLISVFQMEESISCLRVKRVRSCNVTIDSILGGMLETDYGSTVGVSSFSPAIGDVANHFEVSHVAATIPLTLYVLGQALGPCLAAPLSETYGRKGVFLITSPIGLLFTLGSGFSQNYGSLCVLRLFAGLFSSPSLSVGGGITVDILKPIDRSAATALWAGVALLGTGLGPILSGYAVQERSWRWSQWIFIFVTLAGWIPSLFTSESYKKILLARRARSRGELPAPDNLARGPLSRVKFFLTITLFRPFAMLIQEPIVAYFSVCKCYSFPKPPALKQANKVRRYRSRLFRSLQLF